MLLVTAVFRTFLQTALEIRIRVRSAVGIRPTPVGRSVFRTTSIQACSRNRARKSAANKSGALCWKCYALFYSGYGAKGQCPAGGSI